jgi:hypothetical protein
MEEEFAIQWAVQVPLLVMSSPRAFPRRLRGMCYNRHRSASSCGESCTHFPGQQSHQVGPAWRSAGGGRLPTDDPWSSGRRRRRLLIWEVNTIYGFPGDGINGRRRCRRISARPAPGP